MNCAAKIDAKNMAVLLSNLQSGLTVFDIVFDGLESKYQPFMDAEFRENFYKELGK